MEFQQTPRQTVRAIRVYVGLKEIHRFFVVDKQIARRIEHVMKLRYDWCSPLPPVLITDEQCIDDGHGMLWIGRELVSTKEFIKHQKRLGELVASSTDEEILAAFGEASPYRPWLMRLIAKFFCCMSPFLSPPSTARYSI